MKSKSKIIEITDYQKTFLSLINLNMLYETLAFLDLPRNEVIFKKFVKIDTLKYIDL